MIMAEKSSANRSNVGHESFLRHRNFRYLRLAIIISAAAGVGYFLHDPLPRPNGGTVLGYTLGTISAVLIVWLTLLGVRKRAITPGRWSLKAWTSAHVYLGLSLLVLATLHTGLQFGWNIHTLAYAAMIVVIASGVMGIWLYRALPAKMGRNREEMTREQMVGELNALDRRLTKAAQPLPQELVHVVSQSIQRTRISRGVLSRLSTRQPNDATAKALGTLRQAHLHSDGTSRAAIADVISMLEQKQASLARARRHVRFKTMLELWLYVHVPVTFLLLAALTAHIVSVFFYW